MHLELRACIFLLFSFQTKQTHKIRFIFFTDNHTQYGNTGSGVFKWWGTKLERFLPKLLNFENWVSGEVSKIGHHFSKQSYSKIDFIKN